jgi:hypothetical protein
MCTEVGREKKKCSEGGAGQQVEGCRTKVFTVVLLERVQAVWILEQ